MLADKSLTRRIKGRIYDLYYNGPKLHMVVLRTKRARYWVVNTLLDPLSNETMLAIAKGLKPLAREAALGCGVKVAVFGAGYVGLVTGACLADLGHDVVVRDIVADEDRRAPPRRGADPRARARRAARAERRAARPSRPTSARRSRTRTSSTSPSGRRRPSPGTPT